MEDETAYSELDKRWQSVCKILFAEEIGELSDFENWLKEGIDPLIQKKSHLTGKDVIFYVSEYGEGAKFAAFEEVWDKRSEEPIDINKIKDIDSLIESVQERICFTGNVVLGNFGFVEKSSNINDSFYVLDSGFIGDSKRVAYSSIVKYSEDVFGCNAVAECKQIIKCTNASRKIMRSFELWKCEKCSDSFYSHNLNNCQDCIFCFNQMSKRYSIGNLALSKDKYYQLKSKLLGEMAEQLKKDKRLPSLVDIAVDSKKRAKSPVAKISDFAEQTCNPVPLEQAFGSTTKIILGKKLEEMNDYVPWLMQHVKRIDESKSVVSGKQLLVFDFYNFARLPKDNLVKEQEAEELGRLLSLSEGDLDGVSFKKIPDVLGKVVYFSPEIVVGNNENVCECQTFDSSNSLRVATVVYSKYCAYSNWARSSEHIFGSCVAHESSFCLKCYYSINLSRCFEVDSSRNCSDCYYCHNCENCHNAILCFNTKNLNYAVGNVVVGRERFFEIKKILLNHINKELENKKMVPLSVFNLGEFKKSGE